MGRPVRSIALYPASGYDHDERVESPRLDEAERYSTPLLDPARDGGVSRVGPCRLRRLAFRRGFVSLFVLLGVRISPHGLCSPRSHGPITRCCFARSPSVVRELWNCPFQPMIRLFINGLAASAGGGLTYLHNVIPHLARRMDAETTVLLSPATRRQFGNFPHLSFVEISEDSSVFRRFLREQAELPNLIRR